MSKEPPYKAIQPLILNVVQCIMRDMHTETFNQPHIRTSELIRFFVLGLTWPVTNHMRKLDVDSDLFASWPLGRMYYRAIHQSVNLPTRSPGTIRKAVKELIQNEYLSEKKIRGRSQRVWCPTTMRFLRQEDEAIREIQENLADFARFAQRKGVTGANTHYQPSAKHPHRRLKFEVRSPEACKAFLELVAPIWRPKRGD